MKLVVDTNIAFSAILNTSGPIAGILLKSYKNVEFYSCEFLKQELYCHDTKIQRLTKLNRQEVHELINLVCSNIIFLDERLLPTSSISAAYPLVEDVDITDLPFVALSIHLKGWLWTGDKQLYNGLIKNKFKKIVNTSMLINKLKLSS